MWHPDYQFPEHLKVATAKERVDYFTSQFLLKHQIMDSCRNTIIRRLGKFKRFQIINVAGPTGIGKSELSKNILEYVFREAQKSGVSSGMPGLYLEVPAQKKSEVRWDAVYTSFIDQIDGDESKLFRAVVEPAKGSKGAKYSGKRQGVDDLENHFKTRVIDVGAKLMIFDEIQHLFKLAPKDAERVLDVIKSLSSLTKTQIILVGTYQSLESMSWNGELIRRSDDINFHRYPWESSDDKLSFLQAYSGLLAHVPFQLDENLLSGGSVQLVYQNCCGCIGILKQNIEQALDEMPIEAALSCERLSQHALPIKKLTVIAKEIAEGERYFKDDGDRDELSMVLGMSVSSKNKKVKKKVEPLKKRRVGERNPCKDKVGL